MFKKQKNYSNSYTMTISEISQCSKLILSKVKKPIYLVLKAKSFEEEIIESIQEEANKKFLIYIKSKLGTLLNSKPEDPETFLKYFLIKAYINVLSEIFEEYKTTLSENDQKLMFEILSINHEEEEEKKEDSNQNARSNQKEK